MALRWLRQAWHSYLHHPSAKKKEKSRGTSGRTWKEKKKKRERRWKRKGKPTKQPRFSEDLLVLLNISVIFYWVYDVTNLIADPPTALIVTHLILEFSDDPLLRLCDAYVTYLPCHLGIRSDHADFCEIIPARKPRSLWLLRALELVSNFQRSIIKILLRCIHNATHFF